MTTPATEAAAPEPMHGRRLWLVLAGLMLGIFISSLDQTIVATALPTIVSDLGGVTGLSWVVTAYLLASTASTLLWGKLGDLYGRKPVFQLAIVIFLVGSVLCGLSRNIGELVAFRALQGLGGGGLIVISQATLGDVVSPRERGRYQGLFGAVFGVTSVAGPLLGGLFVDHLSWRWVFYVNLPIGAFALAVTAVALPSIRSRSAPLIDYLGAVTIAGAATCLVLVTSMGGTVYPWSSPVILGLAVVAVVLLIAFVVVERRAPEPVLPLRLFRNRVFTACCAIGFVVGFAMFGSITFLPLFLQVVQGASPTDSGLRMVPMMVGLLASSTISGRLISRWGRYKVFPIVGTALMAVGLVLLSRMDQSTRVAVSSGYLLVFGLGLGLVMQVLVIAVQNAADYRDLGVATSGVTFFRAIGASFGTAAFGAVFANRLAAELARDLPPGALSAGHAAAARSDPAALARLPAAVRYGFIEAYTSALHTVFLAAVPFALLAFGLAWLLPERPLRETSRATGAADTYAMPSPRSSRDEIARALSVLAAREGRPQRYERIADRAGADLDRVDTWLLCHLGRDGPAGAPELAERLRTPTEDVAARLTRLAADGLVVATGARFRLTTAGQAMVDQLRAAEHDTLAEQVSDWHPERRDELAPVLGGLTEDVLGCAEDAREVGRAEPHPTAASG